MKRQISEHFGELQGRWPWDHNLIQKDREVPDRGDRPAGKWDSQIGLCIKGHYQAYDPFRSIQRKSTMVMVGHRSCDG